MQFLLECPRQDLEKMFRHEDTPVWILGIIRAINQDIQHGKMTTIDTLFDRLLGKATQPITGEEGGSIEVKGSISIHEWIKDRVR